MSKNLGQLSGRHGLENNLFMRLSDAITAGGGNAPQDLDALAEEFLVGKASIHGATTFYDLFRAGNKNKKVYVCNGSACVCADTQDSVTQALKEFFSEDEIGEMTCLGRCYENGAFQYQGRNYSGLSPRKIADVVASGKAPIDDRYTVAALGVPVLTAKAEGFDEHYRPLQALLQRDPGEVLEQIKASGIRGRGGAGYPAGTKWEACRNTDSAMKFVVCNADEGDPGAWSDRYLLEARTHSVLFGMMVAGFCVGAQWGVIYIRAEYPESVTAMQQAIRELREHHLLGKGILGSGFDFDIKVIKGQGAYICGEETALLNSIEGQRPEVRTRPPFPAQQGLFNKPTVVNNVETLATLHYIVRNGGNIYGSLGTKKSTGTKLVCLDSRFSRPGLYEVEMGTPLSRIVHELAGGFREPVKALHIGGPLGGLVPTALVAKLTLDFESFAEQGFSLGHASIVGIHERIPMAEYIEHLFAFAARESCGKCFPCRLGTHRGYELFKRARETDYKIDRELLDDLLHTLDKGSLCAHGSGIALPIRNALAW
ncbi:MAG: NAD(P)H-dependent oxidoreductase subunit E, partial [Gammaproteobacteria bacterium]|nr:NAD(P)H-dependent oxidoreductase subunit E [Gammaproteobacteria bacterium]